MEVTQRMLKTTRDQIVVLVPNLKKETESGIQIPDSVLSDRMEKRGENLFLKVISVGNEVKQIKVGDKVLVQGGRVAPVPVTSDDPEYVVGVCREYDVVGFYEE